MTTADHNHEGGTLTAEQLCALADITYRQADHWTRRGYLQPIGDAPGSGVARVWTLREGQIAETMHALVEAGFTAQAAAEHARAYHSDVWSAVDGLVLEAVRWAAADRLTR